jgi:hypothetical protein
MSRRAIFFTGFLVEWDFDFYFAEPEPEVSVTVVTSSASYRFVSFMPRHPGNKKPGL